LALLSCIAFYKNFFYVSRYMQIQVFVNVQIFLNAFLTDLLYIDICHRNCLGGGAVSGYVFPVLPIFLSFFFFPPPSGI